MGTFFLILFLIFLFYFIIYPAYRIYRGYKRVKKQQQDFINDLFGMKNGQPDPETMHSRAADEQARRKGGWSAPRKRRKKIDPDIAENIRYTEIKSETTSQTQTHSDNGTETRRTESQIEDITWTDIEP